MVHDDFSFPLPANLPQKAHVARPPITQRPLPPSSGEFPSLRGRVTSLSTGSLSQENRSKIIKLIDALLKAFQSLITWCKRGSEFLSGAFPETRINQLIKKFDVCLAEIEPMPGAGRILERLMRTKNNIDKDVASHKKRYDAASSSEKRGEILSSLATLLHLHQNSLYSTRASLKTG